MIRFIYIIGNQDNPVKIGVADNANSRLSSLQIGNPDQLYLFERVPVPWKVADSIEAAVHARLKEHHRRGEWFNVSVAQAKEEVLRALKDVDAANDDHRFRTTYIEEVLETYNVHPWARHALNHYHVRLNTTGGSADVKRMNAVIVKGAGTAALMAFETFRNRRAFLYSLQRKDPAAYRLACEAVVKAINALSIWYAEGRQTRLLDEISGNAA